MANGLGVDIAGVEDIDLFLSMADGSRSAGEAVLRSLLHPQGVLWWAPDSGHDIKQYLHGFFDPERMQRNIQTQCDLDERVKDARVTCTAFGDEIQIAVHLTFIDGSTPVDLTVTIDQLGNVLNAAVTV